VGESKRRHLSKNRPESHSQQKQTQYEEDVIDTLGQDVSVAERNVVADDIEPLRVPELP
jgi:hypothetical protein